MLEVTLSKLAEKQLTKAPSGIRRNLLYWVELVQELGVLEVRKIRGYHDEPITKGPHAGQRSIRLNRAWRAFYALTKNGTAECVSIEEVNKHIYNR